MYAKLFMPSPPPYLATLRFRPPSNDFLIETLQPMHALCTMYIPKVLVGGETARQLPQVRIGPSLSVKATALLQLLPYVDNFHSQFWKHSRRVALITKLFPSEEISPWLYIPSLQ